VVDDFATMRKVVAKSVETDRLRKYCRGGRWGFRSQDTETQKIDFIVSDWNMPNMTGLELLKAVRADSELTATPFSW